MVTSQNGVQFAVLICLLWCSLSTAKGILAIRRTKSYEIPENLDAFPDDLTSEINFDLLNAINVDDETTKRSGTTNLPPSEYQSNEEITDDSLINYVDDRWLPQRPQRRSPSSSPHQDFTDPQSIPLNLPNQEEYGWKLQDHSGVQQVHSKYGNDPNDLQSSTMKGDDIYPYQLLLRPPLSAEIRTAAKTTHSGRGKLLRKIYNSGPPPKIFRTRKGLIVETPQVVKRWAWAGGYYRPRPQMDRRAAAQSKHYGCLKRCISIGKLHPIQCHTLC